MEQDTENNNQNKTDQTSDELKICQKLADEYLNNWKQERADFINYKKDEMKRLGEFAKFANEAMILEVIEILDDLEIATKHGGRGQDGISQIMKKFEEWLKKYEVERIKIEGEKFNPEFHEAVGGMEGDKLEEVRAGWTMHGKVIRPVRVKIIS